MLLPFISVIPVVVTSTATWDPGFKGAEITLSGGNLTTTTSGAPTAGANTRSTTSHTSGRLYFEVTWTTIPSNVFRTSCGICDTSLTTTGDWDGAAETHVWAVDPFDGKKYNNTGGAGAAYGSGFANGDIMNVAIDFVAAKIWFGKNGTWFNSGDPASGTNPAFATVPGTAYATWCNRNTSAGTSTVNFGGTAFTYTRPSGFTAWT